MRTAYRLRTRLRNADTQDDCVTAYECPKKQSSTRSKYAVPKTNYRVDDCVLRTKTKNPVAGRLPSPSALSVHSLTGAFSLGRWEMTR
jgi:hypothetical protein